MTSPESEHEICLEIPLKNSTIVQKIWDMKKQVRILISEGKQCKQSSRSHWDQASLGTVDAYVDYSGVALSFGSQGLSQQHVRTSHLEIL